MIDEMTSNANYAILRAGELAAFQKSSEITQDHLLAALSAVNLTVRDLLESSNISVEQIPVDHDLNLDGHAAQDLTLSADAQKTLRLANDLMTRLSHKYVHTAHIFLALLASPSELRCPNFETLQADGAGVFRTLQYGISSREPINADHNSDKNREPSLASFGSLEPGYDPDLKVEIAAKAASFKEETDALRQTIARRGSQ